MARKRKLPKLAPIDKLSARLTQAQAVLLAISNSYDGTRSDFNLPDRYLSNLLWGVRDWLEESRGGAGRRWRRVREGA